MCVQECMVSKWNYSSKKLSTTKKKSAQLRKPELVDSVIVVLLHITVHVLCNCLSANVLGTINYKTLSLNWLKNSLKK